MNLRVIPAVPTAPTVIFSLNWHSLPNILPFPQYYSSQLVACQENHIQLPRNNLALDKGVGFMILIDSVTFDLSRDVVVVACVDGQTLEWCISQVSGFKDALEAVLNCVKESGVEAEKEKKAAAALAASKTAPNAAPAPAAPEAAPVSSTSPSMAQGANKRHRTASGIFSSLVATFISPPPLPTSSNASSHLYTYRQKRPVQSEYHRQHILNPLNKRESLRTSPLPQSRILRRLARAKLVDVFRLYVANVLNDKIKEHGIVGPELKQRGVLDDLEDDSSEVPVAGVSGFTAAGGYVGFMARSMLRNAFIEVAKEEENASSDSDDSLLLTPTSEGDCSLLQSPGKASVSSIPTTSTAPRMTRSTSRHTRSPHTKQIRRLSSILIGMTQKDKRYAEEDRLSMDELQERSLRRKTSLRERSSSLAMFSSPCVSSPLRYAQTAETEEDSVVVIVGSSGSSNPNIPFPVDVSADSNVSFPTVEPAARRAVSLPGRVSAPEYESDIVEYATDVSSDDMIIEPTPPQWTQSPEDIAESRSRREAVPTKPESSPNNRPQIVPIQTVTISSESATASPSSDMTMDTSSPITPSDSPMQSFRPSGVEFSVIKVGSGNSVNNNSKRIPEELVVASSHLVEQGPYQCSRDTPVSPTRDVNGELWSTPRAIDGGIYVV